MPDPNTSPRELTLEQWRDYGDSRLCACGNCHIEVKGYYLDRNRASTTYLKLLPIRFAKGHSIRSNRRKRIEIEIIQSI